MKVLSFLELQEVYHNTGNDRSKEFSFVADFVGCRNQNIYQFYSQPFKPELITELFDTEDIDKIDYQFPLYRNIDSHYQKMQYALTKEYCGEDGYPMPVWQTGARTLDDFINDCQRAGIELTWR